MMVKKWVLSFLIFRLFSLPASSQVSDTGMILLKKLDSIKNSLSVSKHFAAIYFNTTSRAVNFYLKSSETEKKFIQRLETRFAEFFFRSAEDYSHGAAVPYEWKSYFADSSLSRLQYELFGINAHINGDIWQALTVEFSLKEIQENKRSYLSFQKGLIRQYREFYISVRNSSSKIRLLHVATAGLDKLFGRMLLARWRKRQLRLALLYFTNTQKFKIKLRKLHRKMEHINHMILQHL